VSRRRARELALQVLFQIDVGRADPQTAFFQALTREREEQETPGELRERDVNYARDLVLGTWEHRQELDRVIGQYARDWTVDRMAAVDRNILRMSIYEIMHCDDVPDGAVADEAVELAKTFSTPEAAKFINGILGSVIRGLEQGAIRAESDPS